MRINFPFVYIPINWNAAWDKYNIRIFAWHFQVIKDSTRRGVWLSFNFNWYHFKMFFRWLIEYNVRWSFYQKYEGLDASLKVFKL